MKPYYEDDAVTIYHGDCREVLPIKVTSIVTDPPYGLGFRGAEWDDAIPEWLALARASAAVVAFTTAPTTLWDYPRPDWLLSWHRQAAQSRTAYGGFNHWTPVLVYGRGLWSPDVFVLHAMAHRAKGLEAAHPSPKPYKFASWLINGCPLGTVLDPFMGSGTTLVAAKNLGRKAIGIEIEERYCEIAAQRCSQGVLDFGGAA